MGANMLSRLNNQLEKFWEYISGPELWLGIGSAAFKIILILILAIIVVKMSKEIIYKVFKRPNGDRAAPIRISVRREKTLKKLIANVISYVVYFIATLMILDNVLGFNEIGRASCRERV